MGVVFYIKNDLKCSNARSELSRTHPRREADRRTGVPLPPGADEASVHGRARPSNQFLLHLVQRGRQRLGHPRTFLQRS